MTSFGEHITRKLLLLIIICVAFGFCTVQSNAETVNLKTPKLTSVTAKSVCRAELVWTSAQSKPTDKVYYEIYRATGSSYSKIYTTRANATKVVVLGVNGKTCKYKVRAMVKLASGKSVYSSYSSVKSVYTKAQIGQAVSYGKPRYGVDGKTGDSTGKEILISKYEYSSSTSSHYHWDTVIRVKDPAKREKVAATVEAVCRNNNIGYRQMSTSLYKQAKAVNWNIKKITTPCDTSCTRLVCVGINAAGIKFPYNIDSFQIKAAVLNTKVRHRAIDKYNRYTGPMTTYDYTNLGNKEQFEVFTTKEYYSTYKKLKRGDILVDGERHTAVVL